MTEVDESQKVPDPGESPRAEPMSTAPAPTCESEDPPLNAEGRERPGFLLKFPDHPDLRALAHAFEVGNYEAVRVGAPKLQKTSDDPAVRAAARELRRRIDPDPLTKYLLAIALLLFVYLVWYTYGTHSR
jgi:hypothetical protein